MNLEKLLEQHLQASAADQPPYLPDLEAIKARGNRRRFTNRLVIVTGVAAAVVLTVALASSLFPGEPEAVSPSPVTTPAPIDVPAVETTLDHAVAFFGEDGLVIQADGVDRIVPGDRYYESIYSLISDGAGGLLFQHAVAPPPWNRSSIMRLAAGAATPEVVVPGDSGTVGPSRVLLGLVDGGFAYVDYVYVGEDIALTVHVAVVDGSQSRVALDASFPTSVVSTELVAAAGDRIVIAEYGTCGTVRIYDLSGQPVTSTTLGCELALNDLALSPDGSQLLILGRSNNSGQLVLVDTATGAVRSTLDAGDVWAVAWGSDREALVIGSDGVGRINVDTGAFEAIREGFNFRIETIGTVVLADDATTGSGLDELPCTPAAVPEALSTDWMAQADQAAIDTWQQLRELAAACEWEQLSDIAGQDQTAISFGGPVRLAKLWVLTAASGFNSGQSLLDVTSMAPARTTDGWIWPAVAGTDAAADWQVLVDAGLLTEQEVGDMKDFGGYIGYRVGIADDGTWQFGIAGD